MMTKQASEQPDKKERHGVVGNYSYPAQMLSLRDLADAGLAAKMCVQPGRVSGFFRPILVEFRCRLRS